ncbi:MAG: pyruvate kinase [Phycisphaeraceae bacterium]|nr:pyruvate kinase [Phycisphaeraceae bacterium]
MKSWFDGLGHSYRTPIRIRIFGVIPAKPFILTKIIATLGPASCEIPVLTRLIESGVRVFRLNFSHGDPESHLQLLTAARQASEEVGIPVGVLGDLCGPKIRVGKVVEGGVELQMGQPVYFQRDPILTGEDPDAPVTFNVTYDRLIDEVEPGQRLMINDGNIHVLVMDKTEDKLIGTVTTPGTVTSAKGVNLPETALTVPSVTAYDWKCADWAMEHGVDFLALSFVRKAEDVIKLRQYMKRKLKGRLPLPIIAKIEKPQAIDDLENIVDASDSIMVARGDLGVEMDLASVPIIQKKIINMAHDYGKPVIVATQMLESMIEFPTPTRAEASDVANAIFDGTDCVMLSGETAVGKHATKAVDHMSRIALKVQEHIVGEKVRWGKPPAKLQADRSRMAALAHGVMTIVRDMNVKHIVVWSQNGGAARHLSKNRPTLPILAFSSDHQSLRRMTPLFGVKPMYMEQPADTEDFIWQVDQLMQESKMCKVGEALLVVAGEPIGKPGSTSNIHIHYVGDYFGESG